MPLASSLRSCLGRSKTERPLLAWLKQHPLVLSHAIGGDTLPNHVISEFPFGSDFRADFVALGSFSGGWTVNFVELEPPTVPLFTAKGLPAKRLNGAVSQVDAWRTFIEKHRPTVVRELSKFLQKRDLVWGASNTEPTDSCGWPLHHPRSSLIWSYYVVIGRRRDLTDTDIERKAGFRAHHQCEVMTYDRLLEVAGQLDKFRKITGA